MCQVNFKLMKPKMRVPIAQPANIKILKPKYPAKFAPVENTKTNLAKSNVKDAQTGITKKLQLKTDLCARNARLVNSAIKTMHSVVKNATLVCIKTSKDKNPVHRVQQGNTKMKLVNPQPPVAQHVLQESMATKHNWLIAAIVLSIPIPLQQEPMPLQLVCIVHRVSKRTKHRHKQHAPKKEHRVNWVNIKMLLHRFVSIVLVDGIQISQAKHFVLNAPLVVM